MRFIKIILILIIFTSCNRYTSTYTWESHFIQQKYIPVDNNIKFIKYYRAKVIQKYAEKWNNHNVQICHCDKSLQKLVKGNKVKIKGLTGSIYITILPTDSIKQKHKKLLINTRCSN